MKKITRKAAISMLRLKRKFLNLFSQSWLTRNIHAEEIHARIFIVFYTILMALGVCFFIKFNYVPTRGCEVQIEQVRSNFDYQVDSFSCSYCSLTRADIKVKAVMTFQPVTDTAALYIGIDSKDLTILNKDTHPVYVYKAYKHNSNAEEALLNADFVEHKSGTKTETILHDKLKDKLADYKNEIELLDSLRAECDSHIQHSDYSYYIGLRQYTNENLFLKNKQFDYKTTAVDNITTYTEMKGPITDFTNINYFTTPLSDTRFCSKQLGSIFSTPFWFTLSDISQSYYVFKLRTFTFDKVTFSIDFTGATNFSKMIPEPDEIRMNAILFTDPYKIEQIKKEGLAFHVEFTELKNKQNVRNFALTSLMALVIGAFIKELFVLLYHYMSERKRKKNNS